MVESLVSIICPAYNSEIYISSMIQSVIAQTYKDWELIIIDDKSTDKTTKIIREWISRDERIELIELSQNAGAASARNQGIKHCKGRYLSFIDSDDLWLPKFLEKSLNLHFSSKDIVFTFTSYKRKNSDLSVNFSSYIVPNTVNFTALLRSGHIPCLTVLIDLKFTGKIFMPDIKMRQDYAFFLRVIQKTGKAYGIKDELAIYRIRPNSLSRNKFLAMKFIYRVYRSEVNLSVICSSYFLIVYGLNGLRKYRGIRSKT